MRPGGVVVADRNVEAERPSRRQQHHQDEEKDEKTASQDAGRKIESVEKNAHEVSGRPAMMGANALYKQVISAQ